MTIQGLLLDCTISDTSGSSFFLYIDQDKNVTTVKKRY